MKVLWFQEDASPLLPIDAVYVYDKEEENIGTGHDPDPDKNFGSGEKYIPF